LETGCLGECRTKREDVARGWINVSRVKLSNYNYRDGDDIKDKKDGVCVMCRTDKKHTKTLS